MSHVIQVKRSNGGTYRVEFLKGTGRVRVRCNCLAGSIGQICRHKRGLISGNVKLLHDPDQVEILAEILRWPEMLALAQNAAEYEHDMEAIRRKKSQLEAQEQLIRSRYASDCLDGVH
jgi:hypothetical protein